MKAMNSANGVTAPGLHILRLPEVVTSDNYFETVAETLNRMGLGGELALVCGKT